MDVLADHMSRVGDFGSHMSWYGPLMGLVWLVIVGAIVVGVILVTRALTNRPPAGGAGAGAATNALRILEERFARGEIDLEEFRTRRDALRG